MQITKVAHLLEPTWCSLAVNLFVVTRDQARGFTLKSNGDGTCGGAPVSIPSIRAPFPVWRSKILWGKVFKMAIRHLGFLDFGNFNSWSCSEGPDASLCQISSKSIKQLWKRIVIFRFFKMAAVHHLGFVGRILGPPTNSAWKFYHCAKLSLNPSGI